MKCPKGRGLLPAVLACVLCLAWSLGPAFAQGTSDGGLYGSDSDQPARLGPKPKPLSNGYVEPAAPPAPRVNPGSKSTRAGKRVKNAPAARSPRPLTPRLANEPKPKPKPRPAKPVKPVKPVKKARPVKQAPPAPKQVKAPKATPRHAAPPAVHISTRAVQQALNRAGYPAPLDGKLNKKTRHALRSFQRAHGLPASGQPDRATLARLGLL